MAKMMISGTFLANSNEFCEDFEEILKLQEVVFKHNQFIYVKYT
jgi:hypothetical protein